VILARSSFTRAGLFFRSHCDAGDFAQRGDSGEDFLDAGSAASPNFEEFFELAVRFWASNCHSSDQWSVDG
jgi:hypothetical protein